MKVQRKTLTALLALGCAGMAIAAAAPAPAPVAAQDAPQDVRLIPRDVIFGNPTRAQGRISPDGRHVSWLAPVDGVMNIWVAPADDPSAARPITQETNRNLTSHFWAPDSAHILYAQDEGGNENFHIHAVDIATGTDRDLTPVDGSVRATVQGVSRLRPDVVLIGLNDRNPQLFDLYEVDYRTGARTKVIENPGFGSWVTDEQLRPRFGLQQVPGGGMKLSRRGDDGSWNEVLQIGAEDAFGTAPIGFNRAGDTLYWVDSRGRDKAALVAMNPETLETRVIAASDRADIQGLERDPETYEPIAYSVNYLRNEWTALNDEMRADLDFLRSNLDGELGIGAATDDGSKVIVISNAAQAPSVFYVFDREARTLTKMFETRPDLSNYALEPMHPVEIPSSDGRTLVSYLTLPPGADADGDGRADAAVPMVLFVHGGPWSRDGYGYNTIHQWLANRGYAVLSVNYRGSTGFGKDFVNAAAGEWAGAMHQDLIDAVDWAIANGTTTRDKVAIMGGSYGGYATLVGLTFTPDRFACGVDIVGPSNLKTLMESFPPYWRPMLEGTFYKHIGDPSKPEDVADMMARSPISRVDAIRAPLLIGQGANDPRVVKAEADQIVDAMRARSLPVTYVLYPDEGHGFVRPPNNKSFFAISEGFLSQCLGGRAEPVGDDFDGSSLQVLEGADYVPGLAAALAARSQAAAEEAGDTAGE